MRRVEFRAGRCTLADDGTFTGATADVLASWDIKRYEHCPTEPSPGHRARSGSSPRLRAGVSEVMNGKRDFSVNTVRKLRERFNISAYLLIWQGSAVDSSAAS